MVQLVFFELEHLIGSSGGVESTTEKKRKTRVEVKSLFDIIFKQNNNNNNNGMVQGFEL